MYKPKVTVYIVNHNYEDYLLQAYYSVKYQSYSNIELIIIDNNSETKSRDILKKISIQDGIEVIFRRQSDLISACNIALSKATGEFIVRLDADDYFRKDAIEKLVDTIVANNADLVYNLGVISANANKLAEAETYYKKTLEIDPNYFNLNKKGLMLSHIKPCCLCFGILLILI